MKISNNHKSVISNTVITVCFLTAIFCAAAIQTQTITDIIKNDQIQKQNDLNSKNLNKTKDPITSPEITSPAKPPASNEQNDKTINISTTPSTPSNSWIYLFLNSFALREQAPQVQSQYIEHMTPSIGNKLKTFQQNLDKSMSNKTQEQTDNLRLKAPIVALGIKG